MTAAPTTIDAKSEAGVREHGAALGLSYVDLRDREIPEQVLFTIPQEVAERHRAIAYALRAHELSIALVDPSDSAAVQALEFLADEKGYAARFAVTSEASFASARRQYEALSRAVASALEVAKEKFKPAIKESETVGPLPTQEELTKGAPVARMVEVILKNAVSGGASDIHIEPFGKDTRVRYRVDGVLQNALTLPAYIHPAITTRIKVMSNLKIDETRVPQDGRFTSEIADKLIDFRVSTLPVVDHEKVVMRILDTSLGTPTLATLGYRKEHIAVIEAEIRKPHGLFLVSGPTGSGKSTTLYAILSMLNEEGRNIVTLEDPIEYYMRGVNQSQIRPEVGYTFASGLRSILRQDPNVIMVGEIRDRETAELAVHAALTGHLMFSTIHTNDAATVVPRLVDLGVEPFLLAATLNIAVSQRLTRKICPDCRKVASVPPQVEDEMRKTLGALLTGPITVYAGEGCAACGQTGYRGRVAVAEVMSVTSALQELITRGGTEADVKTEAAKQGMITLRQDGYLKALAGLTTVAEVMRISEE